MANKLVSYNPATGAFETAASSLTVTQSNFDVAVSNQTDFVITAFSALTPMAVFLNGVRQREGTQWSRNVANSKVVFASSVPINSWVLIEKFE
ncbi:MAG: hypothetical protein ACXVCY_04650 [Pseudobdellovibrionaceae bacterium]